MIFLFFTALLSNFYIGYLVFHSYFRTFSISFHQINLIAFFSLLSFGLLPIKIKLSPYFFLYIPLFIGFFPFLFNLANYSKHRFQNYKTTINFLECLEIHLQMGQSFINSLGLASKNLPPSSGLNIFFKKNVVLQQPKSRNCTVFYELEQDLATLSQQNLGKRELLGFIKRKFQLNFELEQKIRLASTQYRTQSFALIFFWAAALIGLILNGSIYIYIKTVILSGILMVLGLILAKRLLVRNAFRI